MPVVPTLPSDAVGSESATTVLHLHLQALSRADDVTTAAESAFVAAITVARSPAGWDPREVWLARVHRPRLHRHARS
jgi:hypothetical protein